MTKIIRHHKFPRSRKFIPTEAESVPIDPFRLLDKRISIMRNLSNPREKVEVSDEWRHRRNNLDKKKDRWIGKTIFFAHGKASGEWRPHGDDGNGACVALCRGASNLKPVGLNELFVPSKVTVRVSSQEREGDQSEQAISSERNAPIRVTLYRRNKESRHFDCNFSHEDIDIEREGTKIEIGLHEIGDKEDAFVLMCAEDDNRFERYMRSQRYCHHVPSLQMTIFFRHMVGLSGKLP